MAKWNIEQQNQNQNHQQLIDTLRFSDCDNGTVIIKIDDRLVFGKINNLEVRMAPQTLTELEIKAWVIKE
jgi:hypothetical protein